MQAEIQNPSLPLARHPVTAKFRREIFMPRFEIDVDPCDHITADAIGAPGQRVFYIQAFQESRARTVTIIIEKVQLQSLTVGIEQFLAQLVEQNPELGEASPDF